MRPLAFAVVLAIVAVFALLMPSPPAVSQAGEEVSPAGREEAALTTTRYRLEVVRVDLRPEAVGSAFSMADLGESPAAPIRPRASGAAGQGWLAAVPVPHHILDGLAGRGAVAVLYAGDVEGRLGAQVHLDLRRTCPFEYTESRGEATLVATQSFNVGLSFFLTPGPGDEHDYKLEFSVFTGRAPGRVPGTFTVLSEGLVTLPDGYTAVFAFLDREDGEAGDEDAVAEYFALLTRTDLVRK